MTRQVQKRRTAHLLRKTDPLRRGNVLQISQASLGCPTIFCYESNASFVVPCMSAQGRKSGKDFRVSEIAKVLKQRPEPQGWVQAASSPQVGNRGSAKGTQ